ncbi:esterase/lipase superfamily enzyme [Paraburkholderia sp. BL6669N2]|uniref:alpha/beta hydrolase n=1 Tax=Paraburkholderia sp. BL6669N2 TaxID=1938807 RepID=UPI000E234DFB|nr:alpha/beta hydrolase [Paraburkholderia sp. BL6669N2]REG61538.1 esterase/lipase superfamily enzyme [Paraburkholderia sp. BL6669N2]
MTIVREEQLEGFVYAIVSNSGETVDLARVALDVLGAAIDKALHDSPAKEYGGALFIAGLAPFPDDLARGEKWVTRLPLNPSAASRYTLRLSIREIRGELGTLIEMTTGKAYTELLADIGQIQSSFAPLDGLVSEIADRAYSSDFAARSTLRTIVKMIVSVTCETVELPLSFGGRFGNIVSIEDVTFHTQNPDSNNVSDPVHDSPSGPARNPEVDPLGPRSNNMGVDRSIGMLPALDQDGSGSPQPQAIPEENGSPSPSNDYKTIRLFFGTDRASDPSVNAATSPAKIFNNRRGYGIQYGHCDVSIPGQHVSGQIEGPFVKGLFRGDPKRHIVLLRVTLKCRHDFLWDIASQRLPGDKRKALVFVHGFNNSFEDAARRTAQIAHDAKFVGVPFFYSWPSNASCLDYDEDGNQADQAITHLREFLSDIAENGQFDSIILLAHSMGNRLLTKAFLSMGTALKHRHLRLFKEVILAAPDIDTDVFRAQFAPALIRFPSITTLYASSNDWALKLSKRHNGYPRAGDAGADLVIVAGMETIDASHVDTTLFWRLGHSYIGDSKSLLSDLFYLIEHKLRAPQRHGLESVGPPPSPGYWRFSR